MRSINRLARHLWQPARTRHQLHKTRRSHLAGIESLECREVLAVAFTGNVLADFPVNSGGFKYLTGGPAQKSLIPVDLQPVINVTGFDIEGIALSYDPTADKLSVGILQPENGKTGQRVIAGDTDNNLNSGTVDPAVNAIDSGFQDIPDMGQSEHMFVYLDLNNDGTSDIVAGIDGFSANKNYHVALAVQNGNPSTPPGFGAEIPGHAGDIYLVNDPAHPAMEFTISNFKSLFQQFNNGQSPLSTSVMTAGANGGSAQDSLGEGIYFPQPFTWKDVNPATDMAIVKYNTPDPVRFGDSLVYTIYVKNNGAFTDTNVKVADAMPAGVNLLYMTSSQGTFTTTPTGFTANIGTVAPGGSAAITLVVQPTAKLIGTIVTNTATVTGDLPDTNPSNNTSTVQARVVGPETCPPVLVNPHENGVIYTVQSVANTSLIRVNIFGTKYLDVSKIDPATVNMSGAVPVGNFMKKINADPYMDRTFIFAGNDPAFKTLTAGFNTVIIAGQTTTGQSFDTQAIIYNVNSGPYSQTLLKQYQNMIASAATQAHKVKVPVIWTKKR